MKKDRATTSDEQRERMLIAEQIERAAAEEPSTSKDSPPIEGGLKRDEGNEKVVLSFSAKPAVAVAAPVATPSVGFKNPLKLGANPLKANPLKRPNVFKSAPSNDADKANEKKRPAPMTAAERLIIEDQERKRRRMDRESV